MFKNYVELKNWDRLLKKKKKCFPIILSDCNQKKHAWYPGQEIDWQFQMGNPYRMLLIAPVY